MKHCDCHIRSKGLRAHSAPCKTSQVCVFLSLPTGVYRLFNNSGVKEARLHALQEELNLPVLKLKEPKDVRWLSYDGAVSAFRKTYRAIVLELEHQAITDAAAKAWLKRIKTYEFVASLHMLSDALPVLAKLSRKFQSALGECIYLFILLKSLDLYCDFLSCWLPPGDPLMIVESFEWTIWYRVCVCSAHIATTFVVLLLCNLQWILATCNVTLMQQFLQCRCWRMSLDQVMMALCDTTCHCLR